MLGRAEIREKFLGFFWKIEDTTIFQIYFWNFLTFIFNIILK